MSLRLQYFDKSETRNKGGYWWPKMSHRLLVMLDVLRHVLGSAIYFSNNRLSLGRYWGEDNESEHNIDHWGEVLAADVFISGVYFRAQAEEVCREAKRLGFTGIGVYSDTHNNKGEPQVMFHFGVRWTRKMGDPAEWGRVDGKYVTLMEAIQSLPERG